MSQLIKITDISTIRPMFAHGANENIKRYGQLKKTFEQNKEYLIFAEPIPAPGNKIAWHTEYEGEIFVYSQLSEIEQEEAKGKLKFQVNKLYKTSLKIAQKNQEQIQELFEVLDTCIEIPDFDDICMIKNTNGDKEFVMIRWGFTHDDFNSKSGLVKKLIPLKVVDVVVKTAYSNEKTAANQKVEFEIENNSLELVSDIQGKIIFHDYKLQLNFAAYQVDELGTKINEHLYTIDGRDEYMFYVGVPIQDMNVYVTDKFGNYIANAAITFEFLGQTFTKNSDSYGRVILEKIAVGTEILCTQEGGSKQQITCKEGQGDYRIIGKPPIADMIFKIIDDMGFDIPNANFIFEYEGIKSERMSDDKGNIALNNMPVGTEVRCYQIISNETKYEHFFSCQKNIPEYRITAERPVTTGIMNFKLIDQFEQLIPNCTIYFEYSDKKFEKLTNNLGIVTIDNIPFGTTVKVAQIFEGKQLRTISYTCIKNKPDYTIHGMIKVTEEKPIEKFLSIEYLVINQKDEPVIGVDFALELNAQRLAAKTDNNGKVNFKEIKEGTKLTANVYYEGKNYLDELYCSEENQSKTIKVGKKKLPFFIWLIPLLLLLILAAFLLWPIITGLFVASKTDTIIVTDTLKIIDSTKYETKGLNILILDKLTQKPIKDAKINLNYNSQNITGTTDKAGKSNFSNITEANSTITIDITATGYSVYKTVFTFTKEKTIYLSNDNKSQDISEIVLPCGIETGSGGFGTTIKVYNLKKTKGEFDIFYNMYSIPDLIEVYVGSPANMRPDRMLWSTNGFVSGSKRIPITFESTDSLITVKVEGKDNKTEWLYKVYCPK